MKTTHHTGRAIGETTGRFRWCRLTPRPGVIAYRLCLRSEVSARWHVTAREFYHSDPRDGIARVIRELRRDLRDDVLAADLAALDSASEAA